MSYIKENIKLKTRNKKLLSLNLKIIIKLKKNKKLQKYFNIHFTHNNIFFFFYNNNKTTSLKLGFKVNHKVN